MGGDLVDAGGGADVAAGGTLTYRHTLSRGNPALHIFSPPYPSAQAYIDVVLESENGEAAWQAAMPLPVKTWIQQRTAVERGLLREQNEAQLALWRLAESQV